MSKQSPTASTLLSTNVLIATCIIWALIALLFFLFFSVPPPGESHPDWYLNGITLLETGAFLFTSMLCFRNWKSDQIVSGKTVWFWIGLGLLSYTIGNFFFYLWGNVWGKDPAVSPGDFFYILSYVFLVIGMFQAVLPRRLNLETQQWLLVALVGLLGAGLGFFLKYGNLGVVSGEVVPPAAQVAPAPAAAPAPAGKGQPPAATPTPPVAATPPPAEQAASQSPAWVSTLDSALEPFERYVGLLYVVGDSLLLVVSTMLLVAFWGGRFSQSWKLIAIAALCLYIADMFFLHFVKQAEYQEGALWEVFWTLSALFFGLGAVVEYAISVRSRRTGRRRRV